ncbi:histidine transporter [Ornithinimicrobium tianjinense]|uniref:Histidine transporter n=2 Tax=Ornithinimicrobium tianjinense TaxID=1195761 RepID=A0A917BUM5_9MICO|nr:YjiH family protein [Ornithinimicrobium tianjinense]GGF58022.1 histidine transporter [Ornithinimicrobium tianjinense]
MSRKHAEHEDAGQEHLAEVIGDEPSTVGNPGMWKFFVLSAIGIFMFFVPITIGEKNTIPLDHMVSWLRAEIPAVLPYYALALIAAGAAYPWVSGTWKRNVTTTVFSVLRVVGLVVGIMLVFKLGPAWLFEDDMGPFLFNALVVPVGLLVPIGAVFLALLVGYGLMEWVGVIVRPFMVPVFKTPGRSAVDAVASFVGSYSLALLITNRVYLEGKYNRREALIIATGFSTVSATFMIVVAKALDLMEHWTLYFWSTLVITFLVTAVSVRVWPLSREPEEYAEGATPQPEVDHEGSRWAAAWQAAKGTVAADPGVGRTILANFRDGLLMAMAILPSILSVGLIGLVLAKYTPVFDWLGYLFYPITWAMQIPEPLLVAKAAALGISEMFLPAALVTESAMSVKFVVAVVCVSQVIFFSAMVPSLLGTQIPISIPRLLVIWFVRVAISLILTIPLALWLF